MSFWDLFKKKEKPSFKTGLALGSGGAKGFAELGALYCFEQNGIEFDTVAGTSIGSIIGAFYAAGYSATDILELIKGVDPSEIKSLFMVKMDTLKLFNVIDRTIGNLDIEELKKPFRAVATKLSDGSKFVFDKGSVAKALCASSAYPPFFKPVAVGNETLIDGAFSDSVPADLLKKLGADFIVGIDLSSHRKNGGLISMFLPEFGGGADEPWKDGYDNSDVMLHPDLAEYKPISFAQGTKMFEIGYECAKEHIEEIKTKMDAARSRKGVKVKR